MMKMMTLQSEAGGAGRGGSRRGGERHQQVHEGAHDEAVRLLAVGPEVPAQHLLQPAPVVDAVAQHHLLHGPPEVAVRVGGLDGQRRGPVERRRPPLLLHDGARGLGLEEEPAVGPEAVDDELVLVRDGWFHQLRRRGEGRGGVGEAVVEVTAGGVGRVHGRLVLLPLVLVAVLAHGHDLRAAAPEGERLCLRARWPLPRRGRAEGGGGHGGGRGKALPCLAGVEEEGGERELLDHRCSIPNEQLAGEEAEARPYVRV
jgi:hypothetical protein